MYPDVFLNAGHFSNFYSRFFVATEIILAFPLDLVNSKQNNLGARATEIQCPYLNENIY